mmetsp:Transcript_23965/g.32971  ORF Transcript_23965/g.32971 Transcript_23965/m.32971 type:complete len:445 (-) Transcript_23965:304-1638(-)|eukprot:CAMPEP_0196570972 /NCGR_PEP_ID=MMETSP1081-20130531/1137_1 /TAXON_ID=36882 /ORGANISM="Pyramimonas amylifera, Strain CCMP720" /LENGTH=444 /DNA_ID=CAMNT_0041887693 /DNA_START=125 /DNA_END=1459 /DNA_ORIENTATION=-
MGKGGNSSFGSETKEVLINGRFYDVSDFRHPGGSILKFLAGSGADATPSYKEFHLRSQKADKYLKGLPSREATKAELEHAVSLSQLTSTETEKSKSNSGPLSSLNKVEALDKDFKQLRADLTAEGFFKPNLLHVTWRCVEIVGMVAMAGMFLVGDILALQVLGFLMLAIAQGRCGWLMHEGGHYSMTGKISIDRRLQEFIYGFGCGMSGAWWRNQHNKHHATPQKLQHDVDLATLPLMAFNSRVPKHGNVKGLQALWLKYQAFLFFPVTSFLVGLGWTLFLHPRHSARSAHYFELTSMAARYLCFYAAFGGKFGAAGAFALYMGSFATACNYIFINFSVSHTHLPVSESSDFLHWVVYAAAHTTNIKDSRLCTWWMAFLNFQIEHHLFPSMPQYNHPKISPRVKALFEKHGLVYDVRPYWGAMADTFSNLHQVGHDVQAHSKTK